MAEIKTDLNHKYKDRDPLETVEIIKNFFEKNNFKTVVSNITQSSCGSYWCRVILYNNQNEAILGTNGKGSSQEYCLASGYAELYERYCAGFSMNWFYYLNYFKQIKKKKNYFYNETEELMSFNDIKNSCSRISNFLENLNDEDNILLKSIALHYNLNLDDNQLPVIECKNLDETKESIKVNPILLLKLFGSDGLAAGNTLEEAIVQGLSEVYEHDAMERIYLEHLSTYYQLNLEKLNIPDYIQKMIQKIRNTGNEIYVYDLSYNFNSPVLLGVFCSKKWHNWYINLGASPIFNIALERLITEMYQGAVELDTHFDKTHMIPNRTLLPIDSLFYDSGASGMFRPNYPEEIFLNAKIVDNFNNSIFLEKNEVSNKYLISYFNNLNKINNYDVYILDLSKTKEIKAIRVFVANKDIFSWRYKIFDTIPLDIKKEIFKNLFLLQQEYIDFIFNNKNTLFENYLKLSNNIKNCLSIDINPEYLHSFIGLIFDDLHFLYENLEFEENQILNFLTYLDSLFKEDLETINHLDLDIIEYFCVLFKYTNSQLYSFEEIFLLMNQAFNFNITQLQLYIDILNLNNFEYVYIKIIKQILNKMFNRIMMEE